MDSKTQMIDRKDAYIRMMKGTNKAAAVEDLKHFCRADISTFHPDPNVAAYQAGRRDVWLHIQKHLNLTPDQLLHEMGEKIPAPEGG